ncbi:unnamed protein product [Phytophthora lilii]|uniref:Unnamed protein product n=1 Tax=Phytophthora lilii TaxID=2077276 RepID=A0A9W6WNT0_9STRA|nr:unnamed protein product [Phytophthora lilii]
MYSDDVDITVQYVNKTFDITAPEVTTSETRKCPVVAAPSFVASNRKALLSGRPIPAQETRRLKTEIDFSWGDSACACKSTPRPCIFIHGMGVATEKQTNQDSLSSYWGNLTGHAPCCLTIKYAELNTVNTSWTDDTLQQKVCDRTLAVSKTSTKSTIADTIIVTHLLGI